MRVGNKVWYVEAPGVAVEAVVVALVGAGASGNKLLDLQTVYGRAVHDVPYVHDCPIASGYWCLSKDDIKPGEPTQTWDASEWNILDELPPNGPPDEQDELAG